MWLDFKIDCTVETAVYVELYAGQLKGNSLEDFKQIIFNLYMAQAQAHQVKPNGDESAAAAQVPPTHPLVRNNRIFAGAYLFAQIAGIVLFAIFVRPQPSITVIDNGLFEAVGVALLVLIGFGLYFSYVKNMLWSGLGFTFFITAGVVQWYVVVNAFWSKANVQVANTNWSNTHISTYLSDENADTSLATGIDTLGNTMVGGFKCALSMCIIFSAIGGRAGPFEAFLISFLGTILYELNRQILALFSVNVGGSTTIFEFAGFAGTVLAILLAWTKQKGILENHPNYISHKFNATLALVGAAFIWVFFPVLNMDIPGTLFIYTNAGISTLFAISASVVAAIGFSLLLNGKLEFRDIITAPIAGGVIIGCSSTYIYNPLQSLLLGSGAGILQVLFNLAEKKLGNKPLWSNGVFFLFAIQGFLGGIFSSVMRAINQSQNSYSNSYANLPSKYVYDQRGQISATFVTLGMGVLSGIIIFAVVYCFNKETHEDLYHDKTYWLVDEDGISEHKIEVVATDQSESIEVSQGQSIKGEHAYL